jgi:hypothetical protein
MSDVEDDFMCEEEEDYGLVRDVNYRGENISTCYGKWYLQ